MTWKTFNLRTGKYLHKRISNSFYHNPKIVLVQLTCITSSPSPQQCERYSVSHTIILETLNVLSFGYCKPFSTQVEMMAIVFARSMQFKDFQSFAKTVADARS